MINSEIYVSVDVETSGPIPGQFSLLSIGACLVNAPQNSIYLELRPTTENHDLEALAVSKLDLDRLTLEGLPPSEAMQKLADWLTTALQPGQKAIFVGLNAPFDWSFINYYFHKYLGTNPFGFTAIDMKAYFMGRFRCNWGETKSSRMSAILQPTTSPNHNALDDARFQAELFALMLTKSDSS